MPNTWDVTAPGKTSTCATGAYGAAATDTACKAVEKYLDAQAVDESDLHRHACGESASTVPGS